MFDLSESDESRSTSSAGNSIRVKGDENKNRRGVLTNTVSCQNQDALSLRKPNSITFQALFSAFS